MSGRTYHTLLLFENPQRLVAPCSHTLIVQPHIAAVTMSIHRWDIYIHRDWCKVGGTNCACSYL